MHQTRDRAARSVWSASSLLALSNGVAEPKSKTNLAAFLLRCVRFLRAELSAVRSVLDPQLPPRFR